MCTTHLAYDGDIISKGIFVTSILGNYEVWLMSQSLGEWDGIGTGAHVVTQKVHHLLFVDLNITVHATSGYYYYCRPNSCI